MWKIYKDNDQDLSFVLGCMYCQAIDLKEFKLWLLRVIETLEEEYSIYGIAYIRNKNIVDAPVEMDKAIHYLKLNNYLLKKFKYFFPFIDEV